MGDFKRDASTTALTLGGLAGLVQLPCAQQGVRVGGQSFELEFFGTAVRNVIRFLAIFSGF